MIRRLLCFLRVHKRPAGVNPAWSIWWHCAACGGKVPGEFGEDRPLLYVKNTVPIRGTTRNGS